MGGNATSGVVLIMLAVLALYMIWKTDVVDRIVSGAGSVQRTGNRAYGP